jgi:hypothetical protein
MNRMRMSAFAIGAGLVLLGSAAVNAAAPKGSTGQCMDGTYTTAKTKDKGCTKHGGVKTWFADNGSAAAPAATKTPAPVSAAAPAAASGASAAKPAKATSTAHHQATRPKNATGQCADGSYTTAHTKEKGCTNHGGVQTWFEETTASATSAAPVAAAAAPAPSAAPTPAARSTAPAAAAAPAASAPAHAQMPTAPGQVWVNTATKVYHCEGTKYYGNTKAGKFMSEAEAQAAGYHPDHGKPCH